MPTELEEMSTALLVAVPRTVQGTADRVEMEDVRARAERMLFGSADPARLGRYVLLGRIAGGGMGVVYGAYDPELNRKVALKVLHPDQYDTELGHQRLLSEARALAKLDHPNVVRVHDVLSPERQVVVVMALVEGLTLADWQLAQPRSWQEIVTAYRHAGEGLAAAHDVGVVHRDFKPANAIIGPSGRVQVLDFGLARVWRAEPVVSPPAYDGAVALESAALTATGQVVGTLGYISPEQLAGEAVTPASDQFSFCVSMHRAVEGVAPFGGRDPVSLRENIRHGKINYAGDGRRVPKWLRDVVGRGLAASPEARHPSMRALLYQLGCERGWRRWRTSAVAASAALSMGLGVAVLAPRSPSDTLAPCDGGANESNAVWNDERRRHIHDRLRAVDTNYADRLEPRLFESLDRYEHAWSGVHRDACHAYRLGTQSAELFDRRMLCLRGHLDDLGAAVHVLAQVDQRSFIKALEVVAGLPPVTECAAREVLSDATPPPAAAKQAEIASIRGAMSQAAALHRIGREDEALGATQAAVARAQQTGYAPVLTEARLLEGQILLFAHQCRVAVEPLQKAELLALENRMYSSAVEAAARRLFCQGLNGADLKDLEPTIALTEALGRGLPDGHFARLLLLNNLGVVHIANGRGREAASYFETAHAALARVSRPDYELIAIDKNLAMVTSDRRTREALIHGAWERLERGLGAAHPLTVEALEDYAAYVTDPEYATTLNTRACELGELYYPAQLARRAYCRLKLAFLASELGHGDEAIRHYSIIMALTAGSQDRDLVVLRNLATGQWHLARGEPREAISELAPVVSSYEHGTHWWEQRWASHALLGIGEAEHRLGWDERAIGHLERAAANYVELGRITEQVENHRRLALARLTIAAALRRLGRASETAAQLTDEARRFYRDANARAYGWRLAAAP